MWRKPQAPAAQDQHQPQEDQEPPSEQHQPPPSNQAPPPGLLWFPVAWPVPDPASYAATAHAKLKECQQLCPMSEAEVGLLAVVSDLPATKIRQICMW